MISGTGGQLDFIRDASMSRKGKLIVAMTSRSKKGRSNYVEMLRVFKDASGLEVRPL